MAVHDGCREINRQTAAQCEPQSKPLERVRKITRC